MSINSPRLRLLVMYRLLLKLSFKNAFARLSRTLLVIVMITVSMSMMLSIEGLYDGMTNSMAERVKRSDCGEVSMYNKNYRASRALKDNIANAQSIAQTLERKKGVKSVVLRLKADGLSQTARKSAFSTIIGIDLVAEEKFGGFSEFLKKGSMDISKNGVLVGSELAKKLKLKVSDKLVFSTQNLQGEITGMALRVRGIIQTNNVVLDRAALYVDTKRLHKLLGLSAQSATQIALRLEDEHLIELLKKRYADLDVKSLLELYPMIQQMQELMKIFNAITFFIVMLVVFIGIMGVMYVSILERIREFGIMRSIGMSYALLRRQIFAEALFVGLSGYVIGALIGYVVLYYLKVYGLDLSAFAEGLESFGYSSILHASIELHYFSATFLAIVAASLLSVVLPLRKIKHMSIVDATKVVI